MLKILTSFKIKLTFKDQGFPKLRSIIDYISKGNDTDQIQKNSSRLYVNDSCLKFFIYYEYNDFEF